MFITFVLSILIRMGTAERRNKEKKELRSLILEAAKELFLTKGIERTTIRNIADKIDYSVGTVYVYFKDKNEILFEINSQGFASLKEKLKPAMLLERPLDQLYNIGNSYLSFALENSQMYDLMFIMNGPIEYLCEACNGSYNWSDGHDTYNMLREVIKRCIDDQSINGNDEDIDSITFAYWGLAHGLAALAIRKRLSPLGCEEDSLSYIYLAFESFFKTISK